MSILTVGPDGQFATIGDAIAASQNGDVILVQGGTYTNDFAKITDDITLQAVGGRVDMVATTAPLNDKGIFIIGDETHAPDVTINGFDFEDAQISAKLGGNGAGIRYQSGNLTLGNDLFVHNQDGLLATPFVAGAGTITIENSEFGYNGSGTGLTHNLYVGMIGSLAITNSYFHDVSAGHEIKSRAEVNTITNNRIFDLDGTASYSIDLPNGGQDMIAGDTIEKGLHSENLTSIITYYEASGTGAPQVGSTNGHWTDSQLTVSDNIFVNDLPPNKLHTAIWNSSTMPVEGDNNQFFNVLPADIVASGFGPTDITDSTFLATKPVLNTSDPFLAIPTGGMVTNSGLVIGDSNEILIAGSLIINNGTYLANGPGSYTLEAPTISGTGVLVVGNSGADLVLATNGVGSGQVVDFVDNTGTLTVDSLSGFTPNIIDGFRGGDSIHFAGGIAAGVLEHYSFDSTNGVLTITDNGGNDYTLNFASGTSASAFVGALIDPDGSQLACYLEGTLIRTDNGEVPVEKLQIGDRVITYSDQPKSIKWIGRRRIDLIAHPRPEVVAPVRIQRGAFAENAPHTDLLLSPDHAIFVDGKLICARQLINGSTIRQEKDWPTIEYFHIELDAHAILLAEGLPAESYLNTGNQGFFANSDEPLVLHPDLADEIDYPAREAGSCVPFVWDEASVRPVWQRLADRAAAIGRPVPQRVTTTEANLRVRCRNGERNHGKPLYADSNLLLFVLPRGEKQFRLISRAQSPTEARPWLDDRRKLGVQVKRIVLRGTNELHEIPLDHPSLTKGWWAVERDGQMMSRWTDGDAVLPLPARVSGDVILEIHLADAMTYVVEAEVSERRRAA